MAGVGVGVHELAGTLCDGLVDFLRPDRSAHGDVAGCDRLGDRHHVWLHIEVLQREPLAGATEAGNHFVGDQQDFIAVANFAQAGEIVLGRRVNAAGALYGLGDHGCDGVGAFYFDRGDDVINQQVSAVDPAAAGGGGVGSGGIDDVGHGSAELRLEDLHAGCGGHCDGVAVICLNAGDDLLLLGTALLNPVEAGCLDVGLVRLGAGVGEVDRLHVVVGEIDDLLGQANGWFVGVALVGVGEAQLGHLLFGRFAEL